MTLPLTAANGPVPGPQDWKRIEALLDEALLLEPGARAAWLEGLSGSDRSLADAVRRLLEVSEADTGSFMRHPVGVATLDAVAEDIDGDEAGQLVGGYKLVGKLGVGGMSTVWLARDTERVLNRRVALKLPKLGWQPGVAERMRQEWAILASLEHPGIARLYDAGTGDDGRPFIAMEHIDGTPIDKHVRLAPLALADVLALVLQVADALAFAHGRLVVHRDIKPSNILVSRSGQVKLLDFGVARFLDKGVASRSDLTLSQGRLMTPGYASPEQVAGQAVTVASDVYSLGVVLYELLAGVRPYRLRRQTPAALEEAILEADIPPASRQALETIPWRRALRGDLDSILAKAMHRDPAARYASITEFADDLRNYLDGKPVRALPPGWAYSARKFVRRHLVAVTTLVLFAVMLVVGISAVAWQAAQATEQARIAAAERDRALQELRYAQATEEFIRFLLAEGSTSKQSMADTLRAGERAIQEQFASKPALRGRLQLALARLYAEVEQPASRDNMIAEARASAVLAGDADLIDAADCVRGGALFARGEREMGTRLLDATVARLDARAGRSATALLSCLTERSTVRRILGQHQAAATDARRALTLIDHNSPGNFSNLVALKSQLADTLSLAGRLKEAVELHQEAMHDYFQLVRGRKALGQYLLNLYVLALGKAGQAEFGRREYLKNLELLEMKDGPMYGPLLHNHARLLMSMGRHEEAEAELDRLIASGAGERNRSVTLFTTSFLAMTACGRSAWRLCRERASLSESQLQSVVPFEHSIHANNLWLRSQAAAGLGERETALNLVIQAVHRYEQAHDRNPFVVHARILHARLLEEAGRLDAARAELDRALKDAAHFSAGFDHAEWVGRALLAQGEFALRHGRPADAAALLRRANSQLATSLGSAAQPTKASAAALQKAVAGMADEKARAPA